MTGQETVPPSERDRRNRRAERLRQYGRQRRAPDPHGGKTAQSENKEGVEQDVHAEPAGHDDPAEPGVADRDQQIVADHGQRRGHAAEVPDAHVAADQLQHFTLRAELPERPVDREPPRRAEHQ